MYFNAQDPGGEVRHVFIHGNRLPDRFATAARFAIGETGFGTGLNFFLTLQTWRQHAPASAFLSFLSAEAHPLRPQDLARALRVQRIPEADINTLLAQYPPPLSGLHRVGFPADRAVLTLAYGDAAPTLAQVQGSVDAWFLDGFAPQRNPALWNIALFRQLTRLSHRGTTLATFTAAGQVRRGLTEAGLAVRKAPGFGRKRELTLGTFEHGPEPRPVAQRIAVIGAGIAGLTLAAALSERQTAVTVFDPDGPGGRASGNPAALLTPHLRAGDSTRNALALAGMRATRALLHGSGAQRVPGLVASRGVEHRGVSAHAGRRLAWLTASDARATGGLFSVVSPRVSVPVLFYPDALGLDLGRLCTHLAAGLDVRAQRVRSILPSGQGAVVQSEHGEVPFDAVVVATGAAPETLLAGQPLPTVVGGQMTRLAGPLEAMGRHAVTGQGHCFPVDAGQHWIGGTYRRGGPPGIQGEDDMKNIEQLAWVDPGLRGASAPQVHGSWFGERAVFRDRLPAAGCLADGLVHDPRAGSPGVWVNVGYGSRGLLYAPLVAQLLADRICGLPEPLLESLSGLFSPARLG